MGHTTRISLYLCRCCVPALLLLCVLVTSAAMAAEVTRVTPISFGTIDLHPGGDTITINASDGPASSRAERSVVNGAVSGLITLRSDTAEQIDIIYPKSVQLTDGTHQVTISDIRDNSQYNATIIDLSGSGDSIDISIGGKLVLPKSTIHGNYTGTIFIEFNTI